MLLLQREQRKKQQAVQAAEGLSSELLPHPSYLVTGLGQLLLAPLHCHRLLLLQLLTPPPALTQKLQLVQLPHQELAWTSAGPQLFLAHRLAQQHCQLTPQPQLPVVLKQLPALLVLRQGQG